MPNPKSAPQSTSCHRPHPSHPRTLKQRPCPSSCARLWDRLLQSAEGSNRKAEAKGSKETKPFRIQDLTYAPRTCGDDHLRRSFEHAVIREGLKVSVDFYLPVEAPTSSNSRLPIRAHAYQSLRTRSSRAPSRPLAPVYKHPDVDLDEHNHDENHSFPPRVLRPTIPLRKPKKQEPRRPDMPMPAATNLPPSDFPLIIEKSQEPEPPKHIPLRERLRNDEEMSITDPPPLVTTYSGSYRALPPTSPSPPERRRLSKTTNATRSPDSPSHLAAHVSGARAKSRRQTRRKSIASETAVLEDHFPRFVSDADTDEDSSDEPSIEALTVSVRRKARNTFRKRRRRRRGAPTVDLTMDLCNGSESDEILAGSEGPTTRERRKHCSSHQLHKPDSSSDIGGVIELMRKRRDPGVLWIPQASEPKTNAHPDDSKNKLKVKRGKQALRNPPVKKTASKQRHRERTVPQLSGRPSGKSVIDRNLEVNLVNSSTLLNSDIDSDEPLTSYLRRKQLHSSNPKNNSNIQNSDLPNGRSRRRSSIKAEEPISGRQTCEPPFEYERPPGAIADSLLATKELRALVNADLGSPRIGIVKQGELPGQKGKEKYEKRRHGKITKPTQSMQRSKVLDGDEIYFVDNRSTWRTDRPSQPKGASESRDGLLPTLGQTHEKEKLRNELIGPVANTFPPTAASAVVVIDDEDNETPPSLGNFSNQSSLTGEGQLLDSDLSRKDGSKEVSKADDEKVLNIHGRGEDISRFTSAPLCAARATDALPNRTTHIESTPVVNLVSEIMSSIPVGADERRNAKYEGTGIIDANEATENSSPLPDIDHNQMRRRSPRFGVQAKSRPESLGLKKDIKGSTSVENAKQQGKKSDPKATEATPDDEDGKSLVDVSCDTNSNPAGQDVAEDCPQLPESSFGALISPRASSALQGLLNHAPASRREVEVKAAVAVLRLRGLTRQSSVMPSEKMDMDESMRPTNSAITHASQQLDAEMQLAPQYGTAVEQPSPKKVDRTKAVSRSVCPKLEAPKRTPVFSKDSSSPITRQDVRMSEHNRRAEQQEQEYPDGVEKTVDHSRKSGKSKENVTEHKKEVNRKKVIKIEDDLPIARNKRNNQRRRNSGIRDFSVGSGDILSKATDERRVEEMVSPARRRSKDIVAMFDDTSRRRVRRRRSFPLDLVPAKAQSFSKSPSSDRSLGKGSMQSKVANGRHGDAKSSPARSKSKDVVTTIDNTNRRKSRRRNSFPRVLADKEHSFSKSPLKRTSPKKGVTAFKPASPRKVNAGSAIVARDGRVETSPGRSRSLSMKRKRLVDDDKGAQRKLRFGMIENASEGKTTPDGTPVKSPAKKRPCLKAVTGRTPAMAAWSKVIDVDADCSEQVINGICSSKEISYDTLTMSKNSSRRNTHGTLNGAASAENGVSGQDTVGLEGTMDKIQVGAVGNSERRGTIDLVRKLDIPRKRKAECELLDIEEVVLVKRGRVGDGSTEGLGMQGGEVLKVKEEKRISTIIDEERGHPIRRRYGTIGSLRGRRAMLASRGWDDAIIGGGSSMSSNLQEMAAIVRGMQTASSEDVQMQQPGFGDHRATDEVTDLCENAALSTTWKRKDDIEKARENDVVQSWQNIPKDNSLDEHHANIDTNGANLQQGVGDGVVPEVTSKNMKVTCPVKKQSTERGNLGDETHDGNKQQTVKLRLRIRPPTKMFDDAASIQ